MKWAAIPAVLLAVLLAAGSYVCALGCSAQPCHPVPPCHQHSGVKACDHALPDADVAAPLLAASPQLALAFVEPPVLMTPPEAAPAAAAPPENSPPLTALALFTILRI